MSEKKTIEEVRDTGFGRGFVLLSDTYINNKTKLEWGCKNNHIFFSRFNDIVSGYGCPEFKCSGKRKISIEHCKKVAKRKGGLCLSEKYVKDPHDAVKVHQKVQVKILEVDLKRKRIALTLRMSQ